MSRSDKRPFNIPIEAVRNFDLKDIRSTFDTLDDALEAGNFALTSILVDEDPEQLGCSLIMNGVPERGLEVLSKNGISTPRALLFAGFAHWCQNDVAQATAALHAIHDPTWCAAAENLLALVAKPRINVFLFNEINSAQFASPVGDGQFVVKRLSYSDAVGDLKIDLDTDLDKFSAALPEGERADLIVSATLNAIYPEGFADCTIPKVAWVNDHDMFITSRAGDYNSQDALLVNCPFEHFECSALFRQPYIATYFGFTWSVTEYGILPPSEDKPVDFFFSGHVQRTNLANKMRMVYRLATLPEEMEVKISDGHAPLQDYVDMVRGSKYVFHGMRYLDGFSNRAMDSLSKGTFQMLPPDTAWGTLLDEGTTGVFIASNSDFDRDCARLLEDYERNVDLFNANYETTFKSMEYLFTNQAVDLEERFLKFCAFAPILGKVFPRETVDAAETAVPRRSSRHNTTYNRPRQHFDQSAEFTIGFAVDAALRNLDAEPKTASDYNAAAQFLAAIFLDHGVQETLEQTHRIFDRGREEHPNSLALIFNQARLFYHFGDKSRAEMDFRSLLENEKVRELDVFQDDLMHFTNDILEDAFPYGEYFNAIIYESVYEAHPALAPKHRSVEPKAIVLSGACYYLSLLAFERADVPAAFDHAERGLGHFRDNFFLRKIFAQTGWALSDGGRNLEYVRCARESFQRAVELYPAFLNDLLHIGVEAEMACGDPNRAKAIMKDWWLFWSRMYPSHTSHMPLSPDVVTVIEDHLDLLPEKGRRYFDVFTCILSGDGGPRDCPTSDQRGFSEFFAVRANAAQACGDWDEVKRLFVRYGKTVAAPHEVWGGIACVAGMAPALHAAGHLDLVEIFMLTLGARMMFEQSVADTLQTVYAALKQTDLSRQSEASLRSNEFPIWCERRLEGLSVVHG